MCQQNLLALIFDLFVLRLGLLGPFVNLFTWSLGQYLLSLDFLTILQRNGRYHKKWVTGSFFFALYRHTHGHTCLFIEKRSSVFAIHENSFFLFQKIAENIAFFRFIYMLVHSHRILRTPNKIRWILLFLSFFCIIFLFIMKLIPMATRSVITH